MLSGALAAFALAIVGLLATGCGSPSVSSEEMSMSEFKLVSHAFSEGGAIPSKYTCDGPNVSPDLAWSGAPSNAAAFALIVDDPDARGFVHWVAFDIPGEQGSLAEGATGGGSFREGRNDFGRAGWGGPCPPSGTHRYAFELFALDQKLGLEGSPSAADLRRSMNGHILGSGRLTGTYTRH